MIMFNKASLLAVVAGAVLLSSCSKETDFFDPNYASKQYAQSWENAFGSVAAEQDWNMAVRTTLNINLPYIKGESAVRVFTTNPLEKGCYLMAETKLDNGTGSIVFDALKSMSQVFVAVNNNGEYRVYGYYGIENGFVNIGTNTASMAKNAPATRAAGECNVTKGEKDTVMQYFTGYYNINGEKLTEEQAREKAPWGFADNGTGAVADWFINQNGEKAGIPNIYLDGVEKTAANPYKLSWGYENFGSGSFFEEFLHYNLAPKYGTFYNSAEEMAKVEQGFSITTEGGEIELPYIYGATINTNMLGYVYYKDGQDPLTQPHYILMRDGRPKENIYWDSWQGTKLHENMQLSVWGDKDSIAGHGPSSLLYGTNYKLAFFGENHELEIGTYDFPAGYHVVFFIRPMDCGSFESKGKYNYSLPELNRRIGHYYMKGPGYDLSQADMTRGSVKAVSWTYKGHRFLGFEDGADEDLNDIVFWVDGAYTPDQDDEIEVPSKDPDPEPEAQSWILACEDLGAIGDFDFNDVVFGISYVAGRDFVTVTPLAAGGNLPSVIKYNGMPIADNAEIHHLISPGVTPGDDGKYPFLNTRGSKGVAGDPIKVKVGSDFSMEKHGFTITVESNGDSRTITMGTETGKAPMMLCLPGDWIWPTEWTRIDAAYPAFKDWVKDVNENEWYKSPVEDKIVQ